MNHWTVEAPAYARWQRAAADPRSAAAALGCGVVVIVGSLDGGYYPNSWRWSALALAAVAGLATLRQRSFRVGRLGSLSLASLGALCAWMAVSALWSIDGVESRQEVQRGALYVVALAALLAVVRQSTAKGLLTGVLIGCTALASFALGDRLASNAPLDPYQGSLLKEPIGYANALGIVMAIGFVLAVGLLLESRGRAGRGALVGAASACAVALGLTSSRGAWLAAVAGIGVLLLFRARRRLFLVASALSAPVLALAASVVSLGDRPAYWRVAISNAAEHPLTGTGAGTFDDLWLAGRPIPVFVRDAHSLYLETAAELGLVGVALLLGALLTPLVAAAGARRDPVVSTAAAGYVTFLVHAGLDWDWEMPVTVLAGLACAAVLLVSRRA
ncbi:MAG TPA: O-antigen ligase family protein [Gaiellaceae bacterium]|nr:O-antigen ligase family protein [Gaiellaceae bacterium]